MKSKARKLGCVIKMVLVYISYEFQIFILKFQKVMSKKLGVAFLNVLSICIQEMCH